MTKPNDTAFAKEHHDGLTKREYFAGLAMQGILARSFGSEPHKGWFEQMALYYADALIKELSK